MNQIKHIMLLMVTLLLTILPLKSLAQDSVPGIIPIQTEQLAEKLYAFRWGAYRSIFMVTDEGVIVTDPINPKAAKRYRYEISKITDKPVKFVVYSHAHWDHAAGGQIFKDEGAVFVAQERCVRNMEESPNKDIVPPDITFKNFYQVKLGDVALDLFYYGPSHGTCLVAMIPRPYKMLYYVDVVTPPGGWYMPWDPQVADFQFQNIVQNLEAVEALVKREGITQVIASHLVPGRDAKGNIAPSPTLGSSIAVTQRRQYWQQLMAAVKAEMDKGTPSFLVHLKVDTKPFESARGYNKKKFRELLKRVASYYAIGR